MVNLDEGSLICDLAETYNIYDYRSLPLHTVATLAAGLREDARINKKRTGAPCSTEMILLASIADRIGGLAASLCGGQVPPSILDSILGREEANKSEVMAFDTPEEFMKYRYNYERD